jgi:ribosomal protein S16
MTKNITDSEAHIYLGTLISTGRLKYQAGQFYLDGIVVDVEDLSDDNKADKFGFYGPKTEHGGQRNKFVDKIISKWASSADPYRRQVAANAPKYILFLRDSYFPERGEYVRKLAWWNRTKYFFGVKKGQNLKPMYKSFSYSFIPNHLVFVAGNYTYPDYKPEKRAEYTDKLMESYVHVLESDYKELTTEPLGLG